MLKTFEIILDIEKDLYTPSNLLFSVSQNDFDSVQLEFTINQDNSAFDLTGSTVEFACKKPSGLTVYQEAEIMSAAEGKARLLLSVQAYSEYGVYTAELYIRDSDQLAVTSPFYYSSREPVFGTTEIESVNDWSALQEVLFAMDKKPLVVDGVPTTIPEYIGQMAFDTTGRRAFIANAESAEGWQLLAAGEGGTGGGLVYWNDILGKPLTFAPAAHTHDEYLTPAEADLLYLPIGTETGGGTVEIADVTGLQAALDGKADNADLTGYAPANHVHTFDSITNKPTAFTPAAHIHPISEVTGLQAELDSKLETIPAHTHTAAQITDFAAGVAANIPAEYLTATEGAATFQPKGDYLTTVPAEYLTETEAGALYQPIGTYLTEVPAEYLTQTEGDARYAIKGATEGTTAVSWGDIAGTLANQADLQAALDAKADDAHTHTAANITDFGTAVAGAIPANYLTEAEGDTRYMAAGAAPAAHTHTTGEITDFAAGVAANIPAEYLTATEGDAAYQAKGDYLTDIPAHTHTTGEITDFAAGVAANIPVEYLTAAEGDAAYQPKGTYLTAVPAEYLTETEGDTRYMAAGATPTPAAHTHTAAEITDFGTAVAGAIPAEYLTGAEADAVYQPKGDYLTTIPAEYLTETEGDTRYMAAGAAPTAHTHTTAEITDFAAGVAANIPAEYLTETEGNAVYAKTANVYSKTAVDTALAGKSDTGHTHTAANITDFAASVAANIPAEYLTAAEGDAAYQPKGTYLTSVPLARADAVGGGRVGNGLGMTGEYLHVKTGAGLGINTTDYSLQVQTTRATPTPVKFWTGTSAEYTAITTKDANTLYFVTG